MGLTKRMMEMSQDIAETLEMQDQHFVFNSYDGKNHWSTLIKAHALVEAAITKKILDQLPQLDSVVTAMPLHGRTSKAEIAQSLGVIGADERRFINALSTIRNRLVHGVRWLEFDYGKYFASLKSNDKDTAAEHLSYALLKNDAGLGIVERRNKYLADPAFETYQGCLMAVCHCLGIHMPLRR
jgi:hypothetical protein